MKKHFKFGTLLWKNKINTLINVLIAAAPGGIVAIIIFHIFRKEYSRRRNR